MSARSRLTPQMAAYAEKFADSGDVRWMPYLMYFHPASHRSPVVNTDASGFRHAPQKGENLSVHGFDRSRPVRLIAGSSTVFGIGASSDHWTLASRLGENDHRAEPWLNFGGRSFNSTQELLLLVLNRHQLPPVREIVLFSGFNNLGLARLPGRLRGEHGAFFNCGEFFEALPPAKTPGLRGLGQRLFGTQPAGAEDDEAPPSLEAQVAYAAELTVRHLHIWNLIARELQARLTYVLQPLSGWVRSQGCTEEEALFAELDEVGRFTEVYGDILTSDVCHRYADALAAAMAPLDVRFINLSPELSKRLPPDQWQFVDRIHFTDEGHDIVARLLLELLH
ncbi:GDSL-like lipase/acylhydrolase family protein [Paracidovorax anthurii]|uniref:GDSL-like lipase/acylhydrolase family protein n=2 Tax=Paracidovorax anthurii TaxID=78229 RepID=A0A328ZF97_9BURK|nr:hypothetical protein AX018_10206 [Paracidovorax anthurii]